MLLRAPPLAKYKTALNEVEKKGNAFYFEKTANETLSFPMLIDPTLQLFDNIQHTHPAPFMLGQTRLPVPEGR